MKCFLWFHKWSKWSEPFSGIVTRALDGFQLSGYGQDRKCENCGKVQMRVC